MEQYAILTEQTDWPEDRIRDYVSFLNSAPKERPKGEYTHLGKFTESPEWIDLQERIRRCIEESRNTSLQRQQKEELSVFSRHILHNRFLLGGSSPLEGASYYNPAHKETQVSDWLRNVFHGLGKDSFILSGGTGSGKTWGALAYANQRAKPEIDASQTRVIRSDAAFITAYQLAAMAADPKPNRDTLSRIENVRILILDDLRSVPPGYKGADIIDYLENLINARYTRRRRTFITTNLDMAQFSAIYGDRVVSRLKSSGSDFTTTDGDWRI